MMSKTEDRQKTVSVAYLCRSETKQKKMKLFVLVFAIYGFQLMTGQELSEETEDLRFERHPTANSESSEEMDASVDENGCIPDDDDLGTYFPVTCKQIRAFKTNAPSGVYKVRINRCKRIRVYCEMGLGGGGYTFLSPEALTYLTNSELQSMFTDKYSFLLRVRKTDGTQPFGVLSQLPGYANIPLKLGLSEYSGYSAPVNIGQIGSPFLYFGFLPIRSASTYGYQGLRINGFANVFKNCDRNPNSHFTLFSNFLERGPTRYNVPGAFCVNIFSHLYQNPSGRVMPPDMFLFGETHWGGCGCYQQTNQIPGILSFAIGFR